MIEITGWPGEATDPDLGVKEPWKLKFAAWMYQEHVLDSIADFTCDRETGRGLFYAPIPLTMTWRRHATSS